MNDQVKDILKSGGIGVLATDTIYGLVGSALNKKTVERIYRVRKRNSQKPMIILIASLRDLARFGVKIDVYAKKKLTHLWPGKVSVILPCKRKNFSYLHRGTNALAFRIPAKKNLRALLMETGPLVAPSANEEGKLPAKTIQEAKKYFGEKVDFYFDEGKKEGAPSRIYLLSAKELLRIR